MLAIGDCGERRDGVQGNDKMGVAQTKEEIRIFRSRKETGSRDKGGDQLRDVKFQRGVEEEDRLLI